MMARPPGTSTRTGSGGATISGWAIVALLMLSAVYACGSPSANLPAPADPHGMVGADFDRSELMRVAREAGAIVEPAGTFVGGPFGGTPMVIRVDGSSVQLYEYPDAAGASSEAARVSADGGTITGADGSVAYPAWRATPHFYRGGRLIVQYIGDDEGVIALLESLLGPQFAGGQAEAQPRLVVGHGDPVEGAPMNFDEAALQAESVVLAAVVAIEPGPPYVAALDPPHCIPAQLVTVEILSVYKGSLVPGSKEVVYQAGGPTNAGTGCDDDMEAERVVMIMEDDPLYDVGQRYLMAMSRLARALDPHPAIAGANSALSDLVARSNPSQLVRNGRLLVEQGGERDLDAADVVRVSHDSRGRAIPAASTGWTLAEYVSRLEDLASEVQGRSR